MIPDRARLREVVSLDIYPALARHHQEMAARQYADARAAVDDGRIDEAAELQAWAAVYAEWARLSADTDEDFHIVDGWVRPRHLVTVLPGGLVRISMPIPPSVVVVDVAPPPVRRPVVDGHGQVVAVPVAPLFAGSLATAFADEEA